MIEAALPYVDVLSFQDFRDPALHLDQWYKKTGKPVLLADGAGITEGEGIYKRTDGSWYARQIETLFNNPGCVGFHLCGAYQRNKARARGLLEEQEHPDSENVKLIQKINEKITRLMNDRFN